MRRTTSRSPRIAAVGAAAGAVLLAPIVPAQGPPPAAEVELPPRQRPLARAAFVPNHGQWRHGARFVVRTGAMTVFLAERGWTFTLVERAGAIGESGGRRPARGAPRARSQTPPSARGVAVRMTFAGAREAELVPGQRLPGVHHYFLGDDPKRWRAELPRYGSVLYRALYPGVDVRAREQDGHFEFDLLLAPGASLAGVEVLVEGAEGLQLEPDGTLVLETVLGPVRMKAPPSWECGPGGARRRIACGYVQRGERRFGFEARGRRPDRGLLIDPGLVWSTFLGGTDRDDAQAVAVDAQGAATVAGSTRSASFPTTPGAFDPSHGGSIDVFVTRLTPSGSSLVYSTFLGGVSVDWPTAVAVDAQGAVTVAGSTGSTSFPTTPSAFDDTHNGNLDGFVTRLSPSGSSLVYSTFLGAADRDEAFALAIDAQGASTVAGATTSASFPTTPGAFDRTHGGRFDGFVARLSPSGSALIYSTYVGGASQDQAFAVAVDALGAATVAGSTASRSFPTTAGAFDRTHNGGLDGFVCRVSPSGASLVYSTFLGGGGNDDGVALALAAGGAATVAGSTGSPDFPTTSGAFDTTLDGSEDAFVARLSPSGGSLGYSTYLGGADVDGAEALAVDGQDAAIVAGWTASSGFPTTPGAFGTTYAGNQDAFVTRLSPSGGTLVYSTLLGGTDMEGVTALVLDAQEAATIAGWTYSNAFPTTAGAFDPSYNRGQDAFAARLALLPTGVSAFGQSTPGCDGPLAMSVNSVPRVGNAAFAVTSGHAPPQTVGGLAVSASGLSAPMTVRGAQIWVDPFSRFFLGATRSNAIGASSFALPIPNHAALIGGRVFTQFVWSGPTAPPPCPPLGLSSSNALAITIQP